MNPTRLDFGGPSRLKSTSPSRLPGLPRNDCQCYVIVTLWRLKNTPTPMLYVLANVARPLIRRDALVLKSAWKALADPLSLLHDIIATPAKIYSELQPPTRKSARLNLAPCAGCRAATIVEKALPTSCPNAFDESWRGSPCFSKSTQDNGWHICLGQLEAVMAWKQCLEGILPHTQSGPSEGQRHHESYRMVAFQSTAIGAHWVGRRHAQIWDCDVTSMWLWCPIANTGAHH